MLTTTFPLGCGQGRTKFMMNSVLILVPKMKGENSISLFIIQTLAFFSVGNLLPISELLKKAIEA
jgi:hypothetical protein